MIYARMNADSDVFVFTDNAGYLICKGCRLSSSPFG